MAVPDSQMDEDEVPEMESEHEPLPKKGKKGAPHGVSQFHAPDVKNYPEAFRLVALQCMADVSDGGQPWRRYYARVPPTQSKSTPHPCRSCVLLPH